MKNLKCFTGCSLNFLCGDQVRFHPQGGCKEKIMTAVPEAEEVVFATRMTVHALKGEDRIETISGGYILERY